jgi:hypothetical protein
MVILVPAILDPLIDVAAHVIKAKRIGLKLPTFSGWPAAATPARSPCSWPSRAANGLRLGSAARGKFPLSLARKPVGLSCGFRQPPDKLLGVAPVHIRDGRIVLSDRPRNYTSLQQSPVVK